MTDDQLVRALRDGDAAAAVVLYERHGRTVFRWALAVVGRPHDAEEVLQATMLRALEALRTDPPRNLEAWLRTVARNESIDMLRRRRDHAPVEDEDGPAGPSAAEVAGINADARQALEDLAALPDRQRAALVLRELHQLSHRQIATELSIAPGAARQAVLQARRSLRERAEGRGMPCASVRVLLEEGDRRRRRSLAIQAHLDDCTRCATVATERVRALLPWPWLTALLARLTPGGTANRIAAGAAAGAAFVAGGAGIWSRLDAQTSPGRGPAIVADAGLRDEASRFRARIASVGSRRTATSTRSRRLAGARPVFVALRPVAAARPQAPAAAVPLQPVGGQRPPAKPARSQHHNPGHYVTIGDEQVSVDNDNAPGAGVTVDPENGHVGIEVGGCLNVPPVFGCPEEDEEDDEQP